MLLLLFTGVAAPPAIAAPTFIQEIENNASTTWATTGLAARTSVSFNVLAGDVLVACAIGAGANGGGTSAFSISGGSLIWTQQRNQNIASECAFTLWTTVVDSDKAMTVLVTPLETNSLQWGFAVQTWRNSDGVGNHNLARAVTAAPSVALTTQQARSALAMFNGDWTANGGARTYRTADAGSFTETVYYVNVGVDYMVCGGYYADADTVAAKTLGLSAPASQTYVVAAVEVLGKATGAAPAFNALLLAGD